MKKQNIETRIINLLDRIRPFLINDGGNIEYIKYVDNIVYVKLSGTCANCNMQDITLKDGIEQLIINEIPEISGVINLVDDT